MHGMKAILATTAAALFMVAGHSPKAGAQIHIGIGIGAEPACPYGYYGYAPYNCAPYGYYGPEWFEGGHFRGAGRWYHGDDHFYGHVNRQYDPRYGYHGGFPEHGGYREPDDHWNNFHGSHNADPRGHYHGAYQGDDRGHDDHGHR